MPQYPLLTASSIASTVGFCLSKMFLTYAAIVSPVISISLKEGATGFVGTGQYTNCVIFAGVSFFARALSLLLMRGYIIYRNELAEVEADKGHLLITVLFWTPVRYALSIRSKI